MSEITNLPIFPHTIANLDDRPNLPAGQMKDAFEHDTMELWEKVRYAIPTINKKIEPDDVSQEVNRYSTSIEVPSAKAVYDAIGAALTDEGSAEAITEWLDNHPEATTTVQDGSVTDAKLAQSGGVLDTVADIKAEIDHSLAQYTGATTKLCEAKFEKGSIDDTGENSTYHPNARARTKDKTVAPFDAEISVYNDYGTTTDYAFSVFFYNADGTYSTATNWVREGSTYRVSAGQVYRLLIMDFSRNADGSVVPLSELVGHVTINSYGGEEYEYELTRSSNMSTPPYAKRYEKGSLDAYGEDSTYNARERARSISIERALYDMTIESTGEEGYQYSLYTYAENGSFVSATDWKTGKLPIKSGTRFRLLFAYNHTGDPVTVSLDTILSKFRFSCYPAGAGSILSRNADAEKRLVSLKRHMHDLRGGSANRRLNHNNCFAIAHLSDIHLDKDRYKSFLEFCEYYGQYINAKICTGDFINQPFDEQIAYMRDIESTKSVLWCDGNHERNGGVPLDDDPSHTGLTRKEVYNKWGLAQWYVDTGVTPGTGQSYPLYYYKDFVDSNAVSGYSIRLIVLNSCDYGAESSINSRIPRYTSEQLAWLVSTLQDAADNGLAVIVASHFAESHINSPANSSFYNRANQDEPEIPDVPVVENIIAAFRSGTTYSATNIKIGAIDDVTISVSADFTSHRGQFLAWMTGHQHSDRIGYSATHPDQLILQVVNGCFKRTDGGTSLDTTSCSDLPRIEGEKSVDAFNVYAFDPVNKLCKVMRVGADLNDKMEPREYACFETEPA